MKYLLKILAILFMPSMVAAQDPLLTVEEAIMIALKNNYDIRLAANEAEAFKIDNDYRYALFLPRVNAATAATFTTNNSKQKLADGTKRERDGIQSNNVNAGVALNWTLFDGLRMFATRDRLAELETLGTLVVKDQMVNTVAEVVTNYYGIVRQKQQYKAITEQMSISEERVKLADKKLSVGLGAKPELLQAKLDYNAQRAAQMNQQTIIEQLKERLNQVMGVKKEIRYEVSDTIPFRQDLTIGNIKDSLMKTNTLLAVSKKNIDVLKLTVKERKAELWPTINFNSNYNFNRNVNKEVINNFSLLLNQNQGFNYGFAATVPIFNGLNQRRLIKQANLDVRQQELIYENQFLQTDVAVNNAFREYEMQKKQLELEESNILLAKENVSIAFERFRLGASTFIELREAQFSLNDAYNRLIAARFNVKLAETQLLRLQGSLIL
jgi:outer membrane protein TolC